MLEETQPRNRRRSSNAASVSAVIACPKNGAPKAPFLIVACFVSCFVFIRMRPARDDPKPYFSRARWVRNPTSTSPIGTPDPRAMKRTSGPRHRTTGSPELRIAERVGPMKAWTRFHARVSPSRLRGTRTYFPFFFPYNASPPLRQRAEPPRWRKGTFACAGLDERASPPHRMGPRRHRRAARTGRAEKNTFFFFFLLARRAISRKRVKRIPGDRAGGSLRRTRICHGPTMGSASAG